MPVDQRPRVHPDPPRELLRRLPARPPLRHPLRPYHPALSRHDRLHSAAPPSRHDAGRGTRTMNQAVFYFRRYEDASLRYTGIDSHEGLTHYGLHDTVVARD